MSVVRLLADFRDRSFLTGRSRRQFMFVSLVFFCLFGNFALTRSASEHKLCATKDFMPVCKDLARRKQNVVCVEVHDTIHCLLKMSKNEANLGYYSPEATLVAGHFLGDKAHVLGEIRQRSFSHSQYIFELVTVVSKEFKGGLPSLKFLTYCHPGFSRSHYWSDRVLKIFEEKMLTLFRGEIQCDLGRSQNEDYLGRLSKIFLRACRPGMWSTYSLWNRKLKKQFGNLCLACEYPNTCTYKAIDHGYYSDGLRCLFNGFGNVSFTAHQVALRESLLTQKNYQLLCPDGTTMPIIESNTCAWVKQHWTAIVGTGIPKYQHQILNQWKSIWRGLNVYLNDNKFVLTLLNGTIPLTQYIKQGRALPDYNMGSCTRSVKWCVVGRKEMKKCRFMSIASLFQGLPIEIQCVEAVTKLECLEHVRNKKSDVVSMETNFGYIARSTYGLTAAAYVETREQGNYYGVAVVKGDFVKDFRHLRGKQACFPLYNGLGWLTFLEALKHFLIIPKATCPRSMKVLQYFRSACAPGATNPSVNSWLKSNEWTRAIMEHLCEGCGEKLNYNSSALACETVNENPYFGEKGAIKCLNEGTGKVAFLDYYTAKSILESEDRRGHVHIMDYKILCKGDTIEHFNLSNPEKCAFLEVNGGEVLMRGNLREVEKKNIMQMLMELDDLFGSRTRFYNPTFKIFGYFEDDYNLIFNGNGLALVTDFETHEIFVDKHVKTFMRLTDKYVNCNLGTRISFSFSSLLLLLCICVYHL